MSDKTSPSYPLGPWEEATPESQGLTSDALNSAANAVTQAVGGRKCFLGNRNTNIGFVKYIFRD